MDVVRSVDDAHGSCAKPALDPVPVDQGDGEELVCATESTERQRGIGSSSSQQCFLDLRHEREV